MRKTLTLILSLLMLVAMLAGCDKSNLEPTAIDATTAKTTDKPTNVEAPPEEAEGEMIVSEPTTITMFYAFTGNGAPTSDMPVFQKVAELTGVTVENVANPSISDELQSLNTMLASGDLPDIIFGGFGNINPIIPQGAFIPLNDLIDEYAPNIKSFFSDYPEAVAACSGPDGFIYDIAGTLGGEPGQYLPSMAFFIRKDWLDILNLPIPTTLKEYKDALYAFRNDDPNGNGERDEIPYLYRDMGISGLFQLWGVGGIWAKQFIDEDNTVQFGFMTTEYRDCIKELSQWYADGVIDPEIYTRGSQARQDLLGNNLGGATMDWLSSTGSMNTNADILANVPDINFLAIAPPADINGVVKQIYSRASIDANCWGVSSHSEDPVVTIKYLDFWYSPQGQMLRNWGIEGMSYTMVDGQPQFTEEVFTNPAGVPNYMRSIGSAMLTRGDISAEIAGMNDVAKSGFQLYFDNKYNLAPFPNLTFTTEENDTINNAMAIINTYQTEWEQRCITGAQSVDDTWDKYVEDINNMDMQMVIDAYNTAYQRYIESTSMD